MNEFCDLYWRLDSTTKTLEKVKALKEYFAAAPAEDAAWAIYFLVGERIKRLVPTKLLRQWAVEEANITAWLFEECYDRVGDLAETISLVINSVAVEPVKELSDEISLRYLIEEQLLPLRDIEPEAQRERVLEMWRTFDQRQLFVLGKLMTGGFRVGVSKKLVVRALAEQFSIDSATIAHRMMGKWDPDVKVLRRTFGSERIGNSDQQALPILFGQSAQRWPGSTVGRTRKLDCRMEMGRNSGTGH